MKEKRETATLRIDKQIIKQLKSHTALMGDSMREFAEAAILEKLPKKKK